ncbi:MAG TPA: RdgB/HAM1 family non-canonical purine NTP pyrophosphatase [Candidatus Aminicenantes bacterium]|nr:RdgB/HAM1 family non-canonical purine NTP pyrophosphatase [Candidatus Aminicenantes bacterium]
MTPAWRDTPILLATTNPGKLLEFRELLRLDFPAGLVFCLADLPAATVPQENGGSFLANARIKALHYSRAFAAMLVVAEDSGLEVPSLCNAPGVHSARYAGHPPSDERNIRLLLEKLAHHADRNACFITEAVVARDGEVLYHCRGEVKGVILETPRGSDGFGYDPVFYYPPLARSFAELSSSEKNAVSHRGQAMAKVRKFLTTPGLEKHS